MPQPVREPVSSRQVPLLHHLLMILVVMGNLLLGFALVQATFFHIAARSTPQARAMVLAPPDDLAESLGTEHVAGSAPLLFLNRLAGSRMVINVSGGGRVE